MVKIFYFVNFNWMRYCEFLGIVSFINIWKINFFRKCWIKGVKFFKEYIFFFECGFDVDFYCYVFFRMKEKILFMKLRLFLR